LGIGLARSGKGKLMLASLFGLSLCNIGVAFSTVEASFLFSVALLCTGVMTGSMFFDLQIPSSNFLKDPAYTVIFVLVLEIFLGASVAVLSLSPLRDFGSLMVAIAVLLFDAVVVVGSIVWVLKRGFTHATATVLP